MNEATSASPAPPSPFAVSDWFDPLEEAVRGQVRWFIEQLLEEELEAALGRGRYQRGVSSNGRRHGHRPRQLVTTFGPLSLSVPRARLADEAGEQEWKSAVLPAYKRLSRRAEALIAGTYLAGVNTRRVRRALQTLFAGHIGKDIVSRAWQRTRSAWEAWQRRDLAGDDIVRLILDGTVFRMRLDSRALQTLAWYVGSQLQRRPSRDAQAFLCLTSIPVSCAMRRTVLPVSDVPRDSRATVFRCL